MNILQVKMIEVTELQPLLLGGSVTARARTRTGRSRTWDWEAVRSEAASRLEPLLLGGGVAAGAGTRAGRSRDARAGRSRGARSWSWAWSPARCRSTPCARELAAACVQAGRNGRNLLLTLASGTYIRPKFLSIARQLSRYSIPFPPAAPAPSIWAAAIT